MEKKNEELQDISNNLINEDNNDINSINEDNSLLLGMDRLNENKTENIKESSNTNNIKTNDANSVSVENYEKINVRRKNGCLSRNNHRNIGNNLVFLNKYVFGPISSLWVLISIMITISVVWGVWIYFIGNFYSKGVYVIMFIIFFFALFSMPIPYLVEPGIIPRNCPDFMKEIENKDKNEEKTTPRIFTERKCSTCKIVRPPGASHCSSCNNCVLNFDHHCGFISNCVGKRNHKYFVLFLMFNSIFTFAISVLNLIVIWKVFIIKRDETIIPLYHGNKWLLISCFILLFFSLCYMPVISRSPCTAIFPLFISFGIFLFLWYRFFEKKDNTPSYYSPYIIPIFIITSIFGVMTTANFCGQSYLISNRLTVKQQKSIQDKKQELLTKDPNLKINQIYPTNLTCKERTKNFFSFIFAKVDKSLIIPERDLIMKY